jgi:guanylate kinase
LAATESYDLGIYERTPEPLLIVISGPSGVGKDAALTQMKAMGYPFHFVVTATTRPRRSGEVHGRDYYFVSMAEFKRMIDNGELLEHALVYGDYKGIPKSQVRQALASGKDVIMRLDVQGAATIRKMVPDAVLIFLVASSETELINRLQARKTETPTELKKRVATVRREMAEIVNFDYVVVNPNGHLDDAVRQIAAIISAEKCRVKQRRIEL